MKKIVLLTVVMAIQVMAFAQIQNESIKDYSLPKLKRHSLDLNLDFLANDFKFDNPKTRNAGFLLGYNGFLNTNSIQLESNVQLTGQYGLVDKKNINYSYSPDLIFSEESLFTLDADLNFRNYIEYNLFMGLNPALFMGKQKGSFDFSMIDYYYYPYGYYDYEDIDIDRRTTAANLEIEVGIGRIEQVQDARHAILIYDELRKAGKVKQEISDQQLNEFAMLVSRLLNERVFDRRIIMMEHKSVIDSFLVAQNLATERNSDYYNVLSDMYEYGGLQVRKSGFRASVSLTPGHFYMADNELFVVPRYNWGYYYSDFIVIDKIKRTSIYLGTTFDYELPINLKWQYSLHLNTRFGHVIDDIRSYSDEFNTFDSRLNCKIGFYPNTRTNISFELGGRTFQTLQKHEGLNINTIGLQAISELNVNYYFSPKLRGSLNAGVILQENSITDDRIPFVSPLDNIEVNMEGWFYSIGARLNYYIF